MTTSDTSDRVFLMRLGGAAALVIPVAMLLGVASLATVSHVAVPRSDPQAYLADLSAHLARVNAAPWFIGLIPFLSLFMWLGFHCAFRGSKLAAARIALLFGVMAAGLEIAVAALAGVLIGYVAPAWAAADAVLRPMIEANFLLVQWGFDASLAAFDVFLAVAQIAAALVMLAQRRRLWAVVGVLGIASGVLNGVGAFWFFAEPLLVAGVIGFFIGILWAAGFGAGLLRHSPPGPDSSV
jgi:hypothetical protein